MENILKDELLAVLPIYVEDKGNCTKIYTKNGEPTIIEKNIRSVMRKICKNYMIDLRETKKRYSPLLASPSQVPIPLSRKDVFIPIKTRNPLYKNDGAMGYINIKHIRNVSKAARTTNIQLSNGTTIECLSNITTVNSHIRDGNVVSRCYIDRAMGVAENEELIYNGKKPIVIIYEK